MIEQTMLHGRMAGRGRRSCAQSHRSRTVRPAPNSPVVDLPGPVAAPPKRPARGIRIDRDTSLIPRAVAEGVCEEVQVWLQTPLPRRWVRELVGHANTVYAHNERFRRRIRGTGNQGRDYLWTFMRHWLAALLQAHRPELHARLPRGYAVGHELPPR